MDILAQTQAKFSWRHRGSRGLNKTNYLLLSDESILVFYVVLGS